MTKAKAPGREKPHRPLKKVLSQMNLARKITAVSEPSAITQFGVSRKETFSDIVLTTWNIWKGAGEDFFKQDFLQISLHSNLILIQEALLTPTNEKIFIDTAATRNFTASHAASYLRRDGCAEGVMTLSKVREAYPARRILCEQPEFFLKTLKTALVTEYALKDSTENLKVINIHARLLRSPKTAAKDINYVLGQLADHRGPLIIAGDFNTFSKLYLNSIAAAMEAHRINRVAIENDPRIPRECLDQIFIRGLKVVRIEIDTNIKSSDHFPLICRLKVS